MSAPAKRFSATKAQVTELASCVVFALKAFSKNSSLGIDLKTGKTWIWQDRFFDALEGVGVKYDRKAYWQSLDKKRKRK